MQETLERLRQRRGEVGGQGGFTLIELLIVIVILGILAAIVVFAVQNLSSTSAQSSCKTDYKTVESAVEAYKAQMGNYPLGGTTDSDAATAPGFTAGAPPAGVNAARSAGELLAGGNSAPNTVTVAAGLGPWLKDTPANSGHYTIWVANDGSGTVQVVDSAGKVPTGANTHTSADCAAVS